MPRNGAKISSAFIDALSWDEALARIGRWAAHRESRYVCLCNVHSVVTAARDPAFRQVLNDADMATPDGMPLVWVLRRLGFAGQPRISGPDLMWRYCAEAATRHESIFLYGNTEQTLESLARNLDRAFPGLTIAGMFAPPFRPLTAEEDVDVVDRINTSGAGVVFVSLGCPKQELWMAEHRGRIRAVMLGVGAAFDFHAETIKRAPVWMQRMGLEWLFRLIREPRRLWRRYLVTNTLFAFYLLRGWLSR